MSELENLRKNINDIDKKLTDIFEKRMKTVLKIAQYKKENKLPILNQNRENEVIKNNLNYLKDDEFKEGLEEFFKQIMSISREYQSKKLFEKEVNNARISPKKENINVGFQGVKGSFSEEALIEHFGCEAKCSNFDKFEDVFKALKEEKIDYGVLPIENSSTGGITEVYDLLRKYGFFIVGEKIIKVNHNLLGIKGTKIEDIKEVYSHSQAFYQSSEFLKNYPQWMCIPYKNTATSAKFIKENNCKYKAAIGSKKAAKIYELDIIKSNINHNKNNYTRFIIVGRNLELEKDYNKISILISIPHKEGSLYNILSIFAKNKLNMLKIESRPILKRPWEYYFYIDFQGNLSMENVMNAINLIKSNSFEFKMLGNYKFHNTNLML